MLKDNKKKNKKIYLTKGRLEVLHNAISVDDILYEKFRRLKENFNKEAEAFDRKKNVAKIVRITKDYKEVLQIVNVFKSEDGMLIEVR